MEQSDFKGDSLPIFKNDPIDFKRTGIRFGNSGQFYMLMNNSGLIIPHLFSSLFTCKSILLTQSLLLHFGYYLPP